MKSNTRLVIISL